MRIGFNWKMAPKGHSKADVCSDALLKCKGTRLCCGVIRSARLLHGVNQAHQLLGSVRDGHIVVLTLGSLFDEIGSKGWVSKADVFGGIVDRIAQISGASFLHVRVCPG